jgi:hypothetical protein
MATLDLRDAPEQPTTTTDQETAAAGSPMHVAPLPVQQNSIALLLADVDGTLVTTDKVLTPRAQAAVAALGERGIRFALTSSRPPQGMAMLIGPLRIGMPLAGFNGGMFVRPDLGMIEEHVLPADVARRAVALIQAHGIDAWVFHGNEWLIRNAAGSNVGREQRTIQYQPVVVDDFGPALDHAHKIVGVSDDHDRVARAEADAEQEFGGRACAVRSQPYYLDITHPEANKGRVVDHLALALGIGEDAIATIGDMSNDVLMFRKSGLSIAMGNATPEVRKEAHFVTASCDDDGFAKAVERYLLGGN